MTMAASGTAGSGTGRGMWTGTLPGTGMRTGIATGTGIASGTDTVTVTGTEGIESTEGTGIGTEGKGPTVTNTTGGETGVVATKLIKAAGESTSIWAPAGVLFQWCTSGAPFYCGCASLLRSGGRRSDDYQRGYDEDYYRDRRYGQQGPSAVHLGLTCAFR